jgi:predicted regulator of Ras-like GTPase activity (Roadblock/LC7/MglB family)
MAKEVGSLSLEQTQQIEQALKGYVDDVGVTTVLLVDRDGHLVTEAGVTDAIDPVSFGALISANFASTQQIAGQMGEENFDAFYIQGHERDLYLSAVQEIAILVSIFPKEVTLGMVKVFAEKVVQVLCDTYAAAAESTDDEGMSVGGGFADSALAELDKVLGG